MSLLFLDCDGVINDHKVMYNRYCGSKPSCIKQLNRILETCAPDVVLSSAWRYMVLQNTVTLEGFCHLLSTHGVVKFNLIGTTCRDEYICQRGKQISFWLKTSSNPLRKDYVVLDDLDLFITSEGHPFVQTDGQKGLRRVDADCVIKLLGKKK
jgi:hypothetical protein